MRTATENDDGDVRVSNTQYNEDGTATRQAVEVSDNAVVTEESQWSEPRSANPRPQPTIDQLQGDPAATTFQQTYTQDEGDLLVRTVQTNPQERIESTSVFWEQDNFEGINGDLYDQFEREQQTVTSPTGAWPPYTVAGGPNPPLDRVETNTSVTPRDGSRPQDSRLDGVGG